MFNILDISTSGLVAQRTRMNTIAMNIAGADVVYDAAEGGPYRRRATIFSEGKTSDDRSGQGVHVSEIVKQDAFRWEYDPSNPYANEKGYVKMPAIDQLTEMANALEARRAYEANLAAMDITKSMISSTLRLLA